MDLSTQKGVGKTTTHGTIIQALWNSSWIQVENKIKLQMKIENGLRIEMVKNMSPLKRVSEYKCKQDLLHENTS